MTAINVSSIASSLTGTTFDWQSFVDTMMTYQSATITTLQSEQSVNSDKVSALNTIKSYMRELDTATKALNSTLFSSRSVSSSLSGSTWTLSATTGASTGSYDINVTQLATTSRRTGASNIASSISATNNVSGLTLASMATSTAITGGTLTVNGAQITVATTDSLQDVFDKISTATSGAVTASYDSTTDKISLSSASEIILGASTDTSNFLAATRLANNGSGEIESSNSLGAASTTATLANSRLATAITGDTNGDGSFLVNGVPISYNINTDSLNSIISRINASSAGVTASYDTANDRMVLVNKATGDVGFGLSDTTGNFLQAVGLGMSSTGATTTRGKNALFTINDGAVMSSASNTLDSSATGITGLTIKATSTGAQTITVGSDTAAMKTAIQGFIDAYNVVQSNIDLQTSIEENNGTLTTSTLSSVREVDNWASALRSKAFAAVSGLSGTISRLSDMGIDFNGTSKLLSIKDSSKLDNALKNKTADVEAFFTTASTGFSATISTYLGKIAGNSTSTSSTISQMTDRLLKNNLRIDDQIDAIERRLEQQRKQMEAAFQAMQTAQANAKSILTTLENSFGTKKSDN